MPLSDAHARVRHYVFRQRARADEPRRFAPMPLRAFAERAICRQAACCQPQAISRIRAEAQRRYAPYCVTQVAPPRRHARHFFFADAADCRFLRHATFAMPPPIAAALRAFIFITPTLMPPDAIRRC